MRYLEALLDVRRRTWLVGVLLVTCFGLIASFGVFWGAIWTPDTILQYQQAASGHYTDHHPPAMAALWRLFVLAGYPKGIIALQVVVYWAAALALLWNAPRRSALAVLFLVFPTSIALIGVIWKDAQMAVAWAAAWTLLLVGVWNPRHRLLCVVLAAPLLIYGALVRYDGFLAVPPLLLLLLVGKPALKGIFSTVFAYLGLAVLTLLLFSWTNYSLLKATSPRTAQMSLPIFDLAAITASTGTNVFPFPMTQSQQAQVAACYQPQGWDSLYYKGSPCSWTMGSMKNYEALGGSVVRAWLGAIAAHPIAYLRHRIRYSNQFFCLVECSVNINMAALDEGHRNSFVKAYQRVTWPTRRWLFAPIDALIGCALLAWLVRRRRPAESPMIYGALIAAVLNLLSYLPFGVASDQRYAYPSFVLLAFAGAAFASARTRVHEEAVI